MHMHSWADLAAACTLHVWLYPDSVPFHTPVPGAHKRNLGTQPQAAQQQQNNPQYQDQDADQKQKRRRKRRRNRKLAPSADRDAHQGSPSSADRRREQDAMLDSLLSALRQQDREKLERICFESKREDDDEDDDDVSDEGVLCGKADPNQVRPGVVWCAFVALLHFSSAVLARAGACL